MATFVFVGIYVFFFEGQEGVSKKNDIKQIQPHHLKEQSGNSHKTEKRTEIKPISKAERKEKTIEILKDENKSKRQKKWELVRLAIRASIVPIEFYGKVIDQDNMPVSQAVVKLRIGSPDGAVFKNLITDNNGLFVLKDIKGKYLYINKIERDGYEYSKYAEHFSFNYGGDQEAKHIPNQDDPTIFKMWKKGESEPLIKSSKAYKIKPDGSAYYIDLLKERISIEEPNDFDLIVEMRIDSDTGDRRYNWSIIFKSQNGGLIETEDVFLYRAPENGYQKSIKLEFDKDKPTWIVHVDRKFFYLKSRNGRVYAALSFTISPNKKSGYGFIKIKSIINPNGSTNLEYDPEKRILN